MADLEKAEINNLPEIGEVPLKAEELLTIMCWAVDRLRYVSVLKQGVRKAGEALDRLWSEEPETLIGDLDRPALTRFMPSHVYRTVTEFGMKTAQLAAYDKLSDDAAQTMNRKLRNHLQDHNVEIEVQGSSSELGVGIYELSHGGRVWGEKIERASGHVVDINVGQATLWLNSRTDRHDYGVRFMPPISTAIARTDYLDVALKYPVDQALTA